MIRSSISPHLGCSSPRSPRSPLPCCGVRQRSLGRLNLRQCWRKKQRFAMDTSNGLNMIKPIGQLVNHEYIYIYVMFLLFIKACGQYLSGYVFLLYSIIRVAKQWLMVVSHVVRPHEFIPAIGLRPLGETTGQWLVPHLKTRQNIPTNTPNGA